VYLLKEILCTPFMSRRMRLARRREVLSGTKGLRNLVSYGTGFGRLSSTTILYLANITFGFRSRKLLRCDMRDLASRIEFEVGPLCLAVLGWAFPEAKTDWDADRLIVEAVCVGARSRVEARGDIMPALAFRRFCAALKRMRTTLGGDARLETHEPGLKLDLRISDSLGHISGRVDISSAYDSERHSFEFSGLDQTDLPRLIAQISRVTSTYPSAVITRDGV
jgi:hypothetical protein